MVDWPGLLKWSLKYSDGTKNKDDLKPMDDDTKKWLTEAIKAYTFDEIGRMKEVLGFLKKPETNDPNDAEERLAYVQELGNLCEGTENARDLVRIKELPTLINIMLKSQYDKVRREAYFVFAGCNQNNLMVQTASMENGAFLLFNAVLNETILENKENAFAALSSLLRGENLEAKREFIDTDGVEFLLELLSNQEKYNSSKLRTKVVLLLMDLIFYDDKLRYQDMVQYNKEADVKRLSDKAMHVIKLKKDENDMEEEKVPNDKSKNKSGNDKGKNKSGNDKGNNKSGNDKGNNNSENDKGNNKSESNEVDKNSMALGVISINENETKKHESYNNMVRAKLVKLKFVDLVSSYIKLDNLKAGLDFRVQFLSAVLSVMMFDKSVKLSQESEETLKKLLGVIEEENKKSDNLYDVEIELVKSILALNK